MKTMKAKYQIINGKLESDGESGDEKRAFLVADTNDGWRDLRIEIDTDDCDASFARKWITRLKQCVEACRGLESSEIKAMRQQFEKGSRTSVERPSADGVAGGR